MTHHEIENLLVDYQIYHSNLQIDHWIIYSNGVDPYGMYKQALRELHARYETLRSGILQSIKSKIEHDHLEEQARREKDKYAFALLCIEIMGKRVQVGEHDRRLSDTAREFLRFYHHAKRLKQQLGTIDPNSQDALDRASWKTRLRYMAAIDFFTTGRISSGTFRTLMSSPADIRDDVMHAMQDQPALLEWAKKQAPEFIDMPTADEIDGQIPGLLNGLMDEENRRLLETRQSLCDDLAKMSGLPAELLSTPGDNG